MNVLIDLVLEELKSPFEDPRIYRTQEAAKFPDEKLLLMLINETEQTFYKGMIVTATVKKFAHSK